MHTRIRGKVSQVLGGYTFEAEFHATNDPSGIDNDTCLVIKPKFPFATKEAADKALVELGKLTVETLKELSNGTVKIGENRGRLHV